MAESVRNAAHPFAEAATSMIKDAARGRCVLIETAPGARGRMPLDKAKAASKEQAGETWEDAMERGRRGITKFQEESQALEDKRAGYSGGDVIEPPLPLAALVETFEQSNSLRQNVDAMGTNIDGFGFTIAFSLDLDDKEAIEFVTDLLAEEGKGEPAEEAVAERIKELRKEAARERRKARNFFNYCADPSFIEHRRMSREDLEVMGNWTWEVLRDKAGNLARFVLLPFYTMRLTKLGDPVEVEVKRKVDPITFKTFKESRRFRRFVQIVGQKKVWFKEYGDPRVMSRKTGTYYKTLEELQAKAKEDPEDGEASEVMHYRIRALRGPYGLPRYVGNLLSVRGSRLSEEVNYFYFQNKAIPPMIIFVENGTLAEAAVDRLTDFMQEVKGDTQKFWKIAILEGESQEDARKRGVSWTGQPRFKVERLTAEQLKDALFQEYDERNRDKVGESFRLPRLLRGDTRDFNRATAEVAKALAEEQVFQPERDRFDAMINRTVMPDLGFRFVEFRSRAPVTRDPLSLMELVRELVKVGVLTPGEGRELAGDIFNRDFPRLDEDWTKKPLRVVLGEQKIAAQNGQTLEQSKVAELRGTLGLGEPGTPVDVPKVAKRLLEVRGVLSELIKGGPAGHVYGALLDRND